MNRGKVKNSLNVVLPLASICLIIYYRTCAEACRNLKGEFLGVDLEMWGLLLMVFLLALNPLRRTRLGSTARWVSTVLICAALGAEVVLVHFQVTKGVYCPYCIAFCLVIVLLLVVNFKDMKKSLAFSAFAGGLLAFLLFFHGSALSLYG